MLKSELPTSDNSPAVDLLTAPTITAQQRLLADSSLLLTAILWGINIPVVKFVTLSVDAFVFNATRMILSTLVLGGLALLESRYLRHEAKRFSWFWFVVFALVSGVFYPLMFMSGIDRTTAGNTALLLSSMPLWTAIISAFFISERLPKLTWIAMFIAFLGTSIVIMAGGKVSVSAENFLGNLLILLAAMLWAAGTVISGPLLRQMSPLRLAFLASLMATPIQLVLVSGSLSSQLPKLGEWPNLIGLIYSGAFSTGVAYATWHVGVRRLGGSHASIYQNVVTLVAVLGGWIFLGEPRLTSQLLGGALIIAGLLLMKRKTNR